MKPTAPGSLLIIFAFAVYFPLLLFSDLLNQKYKNTLLHFILFAIYLSYLSQLYHVFSPICGTITRKGLTTPLTRRVVSILLFVCRGCLCCVAWFSYWFDNLGIITEGNTYRCCAALSLPLWGNTDVVQANIKRNFWRHCRGGSRQDSLPATCQFQAPLPGRHHQHLPGS